MQIYKFTVGSFAVNNYLVHPDDSDEALIIDAGEDPEPVIKKIDQLKLRVKYLVNTHGHGDHIAGNKRIIEHTGAQLLIHESDAPYLTDNHLNLSALFGFHLKSPGADQLLREGDLIKLGPLNFQVLHTPGHTLGHISLLTDGYCFVGDVIFQGSIGRTDLPLASHQQLIRTIREKIYVLPEDTVLLPGHGPQTKVKIEKYQNPFVSY